MNATITQLRPSQSIFERFYRASPDSPVERFAFEEICRETIGKINENHVMAVHVMYDDEAKVLEKLYTRLGQKDRSTLVKIMRAVQSALDGKSATATNKEA